MTAEMWSQGSNPCFSVVLSLLRQTFYTDGKGLAVFIRKRITDPEKNSFQCLDKKVTHLLKAFLIVVHQFECRWNLKDIMERR